MLTGMVNKKISPEGHKEIITMENKTILSAHDFAKKVTEAVKGLTSKKVTIEDVKVILRAIPGVIGEELLEGTIVRWHGFADFESEVKPAGEGKDPRTGETIQLEERMLTKVRVSRSYKDAIKAEFKAKR
jgi:nucleoid DNA-binding protein